MTLTNYILLILLIKSKRLKNMKIKMNEIREKSKDTQELCELGTIAAATTILVNAPKIIKGADKTLRAGVNYITNDKNKDSR